MDDTWAIMLALASEEVDVQMIITDSRDTVAMADIVGKFLTVLGRTDVDIGIGPKFGDDKPKQWYWAQDFNISTYAGSVYHDGVTAMVERIRSNAGITTILAIAPCPNIAIALERAPDIAEKVRIVAMSGSVHIGYCDSPQAVVEYNIATNISASAAMYRTKWASPLVTTPLDTCGLPWMNGTRWQQLLAAKDSNVMIGATLDSFAVWMARGGNTCCSSPVNYCPLNANKWSDTLFDPTAMYLLLQPSSFNLHSLPLRVTSDGHIAVSGGRQQVHTALSWAEGGYDAFLDTLLHRMLAWKKRE
eukprot:PLAT14678.1.p1 GENE.PLAT14678.1~~PLAT14678.1.p1  ORF type:complete len:346 (-),score=85.09 PLAT14678.1:349-1257(-)